MIPLVSLGMLPLLSLCVGALLSSEASPACTHPPCRDSLVAAPIPPGTGAGAGIGACEGQTGTTACRVRVSLPAISDAPRKVEHRHDIPQVQPKVSDRQWLIIQFIVSNLQLLKCYSEESQIIQFIMIFLCQVSVRWFRNTEWQDEADPTPCLFIHVCQGDWAVYYQEQASRSFLVGQLSH